MPSAEVSIPDVKLDAPGLRDRLRSVYVRATSGATGALADQAVVSAAGFLANLVVARGSSKEEFGIYSLGLTLVSILLGIQQSLILSPYTMLHHRLSGREEQTYAGSTLVHLCLLSGAAAVVLMGGAAALSFYGVSGQPVNVMCALAAAIIFILFRDYDRRMSFAKLNFRQALAVDCFIAVAQTIVLVAVLKSAILSSTTAFLAMGASCAIAAAGWHLSHGGYFRWPAGRVFKDLRINWRAGKWVFASYLAVMGGSQLYPWILAVVHGVAATGALAAAWTTTAVMQSFLIGIGNFSGPLMARAYAAGVGNLHQTVVRLRGLITGVAVLFSLTVFAIGERFIIFVYGTKYAGSGTLLFLLALAISATAVAAAPSCGLWAIGREDVNFKINMLGLLSAALLGPFVAKPYGALGIAACLLVTNVVMSILKCSAYAGIVSRLTRGSA